MASRSLRVFAVAVVSALALAACSSGSSGSSGGSGSGGSGSFDPKAGAAKIRALGAVKTTGRTTLGEQSGPVSGRITYQPYRVNSLVTVSTGTDLATLRYVRAGDRAWIRRPLLPPKVTNLSLGLPTVVFRVAGSAPWLPVAKPDDGLLSYLGRPYDPARLLDSAAAAKVTFRPAGSGDVDGTKRDRFDASIKVAQARVVGVRSLSVWVNGGGVPVQVRFRGSVEQTTEYTIAKLSRTVKVVAVAPPKSQTVQERALPDATGPYTAVQSAVAGTIPVTVSMAPGQLDWTCWKVESNPAFVNTTPPRPSGGYCVVPIETSGEPDTQFIIPLDAAADAPYELLGMVVTPGSTVTFSRFGGDPVTVTAGPTGLALYTGPSDQILGLAQVDLPDGGKLVCGPVGIDNQADFTAKQGNPGAQAELRGAPWNCLPADLADLLNS